MASNPIIATIENAILRRKFVRISRFCRLRIVAHENRSKNSPSIRQLFVKFTSVMTEIPLPIHEHAARQHVDWNSIHVIGSILTEIGNSLVMRPYSVATR